MTEKQKWKFTDVATAFVVIIIGFLFIKYKMNEWLPGRSNYLKIDCYATAKLTADTIKKIREYKLDCIPKDLYLKKDIAKWVHQLKDAYCLNYKNIELWEEEEDIGTYISYKKLKIGIYGSIIFSTEPYIPITNDEEKLILYIFNDLNKKHTNDIRNSINLE